MLTFYSYLFLSFPTMLCDRQNMLLTAFTLLHALGNTVQQTNANMGIFDSSSQFGVAVTNNADDEVVQIYRSFTDLAR